MPFRFDQKSQKAVNDSSATDKTNTDLTPQNAPQSSYGQLPPVPGNSQSNIPIGKMDKARQRTKLGQKLGQPDLGPILQRGFIIISLIVITLTGIIYAISQQFNFNQKHSAAESSEQGGEALALPKGKKVGAVAMHQFLMKLAARAVEENNYHAGVHLYAHAAEEARLGGPALNKQYIDAIFAQAEVYHYNLSDSDKARPIFEKVLKAQQADSTTKPNKLANTYNDLADSITPDTEAAKERIQGFYQKAISLAKAASDNKNHAFYCYNAGNYYFDLAQYDKALTQAKESLAAFAKIKEPELTDLADSHYLAAKCLGHMAGPTHWELANSEYEAALKTYEKAEAEEDRYANCMRDAAWNKLRLGQRSEAKELFDKASSHSDDDDQGQTADSYMSDALK